LDRIILAAPMIIISLLLLYHLLKVVNYAKLKSLNIANLFILNSEELNLYKNLKKCDKDHKNDGDHKHDHAKNEELNEKEQAKQKETVKIREIFIFYTMINYLINFILVIFMAHTQIINRVLTCNPLLYFFCADKLIQYKYHNAKLGKFILISFTSLSVLGCVMHPGGYGFA
jgi:Mannosyltransferase (PIG-V)